MTKSGNCSCCFRNFNVCVTSPLVPTNTSRSFPPTILRKKQISQHSHCKEKQPHLLILASNCHSQPPSLALEWQLQNRPSRLIPTVAPCGPFPWASEQESRGAPQPRSKLALTKSPPSAGIRTFISDDLALTISQSREFLLRYTWQPSVLLMEIVGTLPITYGASKGAAEDREQGSPAPGPCPQGKGLPPLPLTDTLNSRTSTTGKNLRLFLVLIS